MNNSTALNAMPVLTGREVKCADDFIEGEWMLPPKYESQTQPGLYFWAEEIDCVCWMVVSRAQGYPGTEACDDWFAHFKDADEIAQKLARGEPVENTL